MCAEGAEKAITRGRHENLGHYKTETLKIKFKNVAKYIIFSDGMQQYGDIL